jgi:hypothetical protein
MRASPRVPGLWGSITRPGLSSALSDLLSRLPARAPLLGWLLVLARREVSKDADTRGARWEHSAKSALRAAALTVGVWYLSTLIGTMYPWR